MTREEFQLVALLAAAALGYVACLILHLIEAHHEAEKEIDVEMDWTLPTDHHSVTEVVIFCPKPEEDEADEVGHASR